jgi:Mg/Co/Ni transporter MgtE
VIGALPVVPAIACMADDSGSQSTTVTVSTLQLGSTQPQ